MNYRIDLSDSDVRTLLSDETVNNLPLLLQYDQVLFFLPAARSLQSTY